MYDAGAFFTSSPVKGLELGARLRLFRAYFRLSRLELARALGLKERTLRAYETGTRTPPREVAERLRSCLDNQSALGKLIRDTL